MNPAVEWMSRPRRQIRRRRLMALTVLVVLVGAALFGLTQMLSGSAGAASVVLEPVRAAMPASPFRTPLPEEIRGVHVTAPLMSLPGRFAQYLALRKNGLNTVEVDVKDESGNVGFVKGAPTLARRDGAARPYYDAERAA